MQSNNNELQPAVKLDLMAHSSVSKVQGFSLASNKLINSIKGFNSMGGVPPESSMKSKKTYLIVNHSSHDSLNT